VEESWTGIIDVGAKPVVAREAIATGLGKRLGDVVRTSDSSFAYTPWLAYDARSVNAGMEESAIVSAVSQITPNEQEINARVSVVYEIK